MLAIWGGIAAAGIVVYYGARMPSVADWAVPDRPPNVKIVSVDGELVANRGMTGGEAVGLHEMSPYIPMAVIAIEDRRFYSHVGVDPIGLARAVFNNLTRGRFSQGGSTLTQQLAKNLFLKPDRTLERKVQEVLLALWLERKHTKDQILEMYLNRVYFGSGSYGVEAASRRYFGKSARDVTLSQAALLAGLLKAPSTLSPARDPKAAEARAQLVLAAMREEGMIGDKELANAMSAPATRAASYWTGSENYVADRIMEEVPGLIGDTRDDIIVDTTIDLGLQKLAEKSIRRLIDENGKKLSVSQGALVSIDSTGAVRAMVGGYDYANSQFDRASEAKRQPGSAFKPFVYLAALEQGRTPDSVRNDAPIKIGKWTPDNYHGKYYGQRHAGDRARQVAEFGRRAAGHGSRPRQCRRDGAPHGHRLRVAGQHLDRARHVGGDAARADRRLCALRQWRLQARRAFHQAHHHGSRRRALREQAQQPAARRQARDRRHDERHDARDGRGRHRQEGGIRLAIGRQDRHQPEFARRLVRRLHRKPHHRRLVRQ